MRWCGWKHVLGCAYLLHENAVPVNAEYAESSALAIANCAAGCYRYSCEKPNLTLCAMMRLCMSFVMF